MIESVADECFGVISAVRETELEKGASCRICCESLMNCMAIEWERWEVISSVLQRAELATVKKGELELTDDGRKVADGFLQLFDKLGLEKV